MYTVTIILRALQTNFVSLNLSYFMSISHKVSLEKYYILPFPYSFIFFT